MPSRPSPSPCRRAPAPRPGRRRRPARVRLRAATLEDLDTLVRHRRAMWVELRAPPKRDLDRHDVVYRRWLRREMRAGRFLARIALAPSGEVAGSGALWLMPSQPRPGPLGRPVIPYVLSMYTEPGSRGLGAATAIVEALVRWSTRKGFRRIVLHASTMGRPIYARLGFEAGSEMRLELPRRRRPPARRPRPSGRRRAV